MSELSELSVLEAIATTGAMRRLQGNPDASRRPGARGTHRNRREGSRS